FALMRGRLFTAVVGDILDAGGLLHQFLPPEIRPLRDDIVLVGRAMPVLEVDTGGAPSSKPFGLMLDALDPLRTGEVYIASSPSSTVPPYALWGELMSTRAIRLGAAGVVLNGYLRDTAAILDLGFPAFSRGSYAQDQGPRGYVTDFRVSIDA